MEGETGKVPRRVSSSQLPSKVDRISELPDPILSQILSFLPTKNSVATSILSKQWKFLWRTVSNFDFSYVVDETIGDTIRVGNRQIDGNHHQVKFINFVNKVLHLRTPGSINKFILIWKAQSFSPYDFNYWINTAIDNHVQDLFLSIHVKNPALSFELCPRIFSCESLLSLNLWFDKWVNHSCGILVNLPRLETLKLHPIRFQNEEAFQKLILGCPMLKSLYISTIVDYKNMVGSNTDYEDDTDEEEEYVEENVFKFVVYSTSLRRLDLRVVGNLQNTWYCSLELEAPSLEVLKLKECISRLIVSPRSLSSLLEVQFEINKSVIYGAKAFHIKEQSCANVVEALRAFSCAKTLTISNYVMWALRLAEDIRLSTKFERLTNLKMVADASGLWLDLHDNMDFIRCFDNLKLIVFYKSTYRGSDCNDEQFPEQIQVPKCLTNSLKVVVFYAFEGYNYEMEMVEYLLKHASVLRLVQIHCCDRLYKTNKVEMLQEISDFSRKSPTCQFRFLSMP